MTTATEPASAAIAWRTEEYESFSFLGACFDVRAAKRIIVASPRQIMTVKVEQAAAFLGAIRIDEALVAAADTEVPIIIATLVSKRKSEPECFLPIDGWHRICRAHDLGMEVMPAVLLTGEETARIRRGGVR